MITNNLTNNGVEANKPEIPAIRKRKINKACVSCRKRKIKCTGTQPCSNCQAYKCICEFTVRMRRNGNKNKISKKPLLETVHNNHVSTPSNDSLSHNTTKSFLSNFTTNHSGNTKLKDNLLNIGTPTSNPDELPSNKNRIYSTIRSPATTETTPTNVSTEFSRHENGTTSRLLDTYDIKGVYRNDLEEQDEYIQLTKTLEQLKAISERTTLIKDMISQTEEKLKTFMNQWKPTIDFQSVPVDNNNQSIETMLMKNKYRDQIYLGRFASLKTNEKIAPVLANDQTFLSTVPLIDEMFGMYSAFDALSLRGLGSLIQKYTKDVEKLSDSASEKLKATVYIMLRFFDICCVDLSDSVATMANPLENYIKRTGEDLKTYGFPEIPQVLPSTTSTQGINNKPLVVKIINQLPEAFTNDLTDLTRDDLLKLLNQDFEMFKTLLKIYELHRYKFESTTMKLSHQKYHPNNDEITLSFKQLIDFCKMQDILLTLCYSYYNSTLYHLGEYDSLDYLESLLLFLDYQEWIDQGYGYEKVLLVVIDCAMNMGLNRWEFYVGVDELTANRRRDAWWKIYCLEKTFAFRMGRLSTIDDSKVNCLLPEPMRRAGFIDLKDFLDNIDKNRCNPTIFETMSIDDLRQYGLCSQAIIISSFYDRVLYSEEYTSIKNVALPQSLREEYLAEIFDECAKTKEKLNVVEDQLKKIIRCSKDPRPPESVFPGDDKYIASEYVTSFYFHSSIFLKSSFTLISRLTGFPGNITTNEKIKEFSLDIYNIFNKCSDVLLTLETSYEIWRAFKLYSLVFVMISFNMDSKNQLVTIIDIIKVFRIFKRILTFAAQLEEFRIMDPTITHDQTIQEFERNLTTLTILIRVLVLDYMLRLGLNRKELMELIRNNPHGEEVTDMVPLFVDHKSFLYRFVLRPVQETGYHLNVQHLIESFYSSFPKDVGSSSSSILRLKCSHNKILKTKLKPALFKSMEDTSSKSTITGSISSGSNNERSDIANKTISKILESTTITTLNNGGSRTPSETDPLVTPRDHNIHNNVGITESVINGVDLQSSSKPGISSSSSSSSTTNDPIANPTINSSNTTNNPMNNNGTSINVDDVNNVLSLDDFINNTDLTDLYKSLWNDNFLDLM